MNSFKHLLKVRYIIILTLLIIAYLLLRPRKCYDFYDINGDSTTYFTLPQLRELDKTDSILALAVGHVMYLKRNSISFFIFSLKDFNTFELKNITVMYDGKERTYDYNIVYDMNFENPNFEQIISYNVDNRIVHGYKKTIIPPFMNFKYCWINFYDLFKWKHNRIGNEFDVKLIVNYGLDNRQYNQELNYKVRCEKSYPDNLLKTIF